MKFLFVLLVLLLGAGFLIFGFTGGGLIPVVVGAILLFGGFKVASA